MENPFKKKSPPTPERIAVAQSNRDYYAEKHEESQDDPDAAESALAAQKEVENLISASDKHFETLKSAYDKKRKAAVEQIRELEKMRAELVSEYRSDPFDKYHPGLFAGDVDRFFDIDETYLKFRLRQERAPLSDRLP